MKKRILLFIGILIIFPLNIVNAKTLQDYYNELSALESSYAEAKNKSAMSQAEMNKLKKEISNAEAEIVAAGREIDASQKSIEESEASIEEKKEQTDQMLLYLQLASEDDSYMEYLLAADDYTDFIYRYSIVTQLTDYNNKLMDELNSLIAELQQKKKDLEAKQVSLENQKQELKSKYALVQVQYNDEQAEGLDIQTQISEMKKLVKSYETACGGNRNIDVTKCGAAPVDGWVYPMNSFYQSSNYSWDENRWHYAVDLATSEGRSVVAVANGTVISSTLPTKRSSCYSSWLHVSWSNCYCGGYVVQIKHYYNGAWYVSLYMHLLEAYVSVGDTVTKGQVIGKSGGGESEAYKWHDYCTAGGHLHFAMSYGDGLIGYSSEKGSTFDPVKFFPAMKGIGSRYSG